MDYKIVQKCRCCGSDRLEQYLDLGEVPLANNFDSKNLYPIKVLLCRNCFLSQLSIVVNPKILYSNYPYHSSISKTFQRHCRDMAKSVKQVLRMTTNLKNYVVCDIAANDGCLLDEFRKEGFNAVGVEPSENLVRECHTKGLAGVSCEFWDKDAASRSPACDVITATNVLAHVDDIRTFVKLAVDKLRSYTSGIMVVEVPYMANLLNYVQFDTIYHEHLSYFLFLPLVHLFSSLGAPIFRVEKYPIHGGSLRIYASPYNYVVEDSVTALLDWEEANGFYKVNTYHEFAENVDFVREDLPYILFELKQDAKLVMGFGASAKGISLLNYCDVDNDALYSIVDETPDKIGKRTPGSNIPIVGFEAFEKEKPDYILLLAWNFKEELIEKTKHLGAKYIVPIPQVEILT